MDRYEDREYEEFVRQLYKRMNFDLGSYKVNQMNRRIRSFFEKKGFSSYEMFLVALAQDRGLYEDFLVWITINVTQFFRNLNRWEYMEKEVLSKFPRNRKIKCWSAACSTGEEPYTLAMIGHRLGLLPYMDILATDLDKQALQTAKQGMYKESAMEYVDPSYRSLYFEEKEGKSSVQSFIKQQIRFKEHNLLLDLYEDQFDLIICRNVMIYFTEEAKEELYRKFYRALKPEGILFTGSTEQIFHPGHYGFSTLETCFYRKDETKLTNEKKSI